MEKAGWLRSWGARNKMSPPAEYRFLSEDEVITLVNPVLALRGWPQLNTATARVLGAFDGGDLIETFTVQLMPMLGPMIKINNEHRDNGAVSRELAEKMSAYLSENEARGYLTIADSPLTERLCERHGMKRVESPVFMAVGFTGVRTPWAGG